jgi:hypothetical protein
MFKSFTKTNTEKNEEKLEKFFYCGLCSKLFENCQILKCCNERYCMKCLEKWKDVNYLNDKCPTEYCKKKLNMKSIVPDKKINDFILLRNVRCKNKQFGCNWISKNCKLKEHLEKECKYQKEKCKYDGCNYNNSRRNLISHEKLEFLSHLQILNQNYEKLKNQLSCQKSKFINLEFEIILNHDNVNFDDEEISIHSEELFINNYSFSVFITFINKNEKNIQYDLKFNDFSSNRKLQFDLQISILNQFFENLSVSVSNDKNFSHFSKFSNLDLNEFSFKFEFSNFLIIENGSFKKSNNLDFNDFNDSEIITFQNDDYEDLSN